MNLPQAGLLQAGLPQAGLLQAGLPQIGLLQANSPQAGLLQAGLPQTGILKMSLLQMSFAGAVMILVTILVRAIAIHKLPKRTFLILWGLIVLRLLLPISIPSTFSVYTVVGKQALNSGQFDNQEISKIIPIAMSSETETATNQVNSVKSASQLSFAAIVNHLVPRKTVGYFDFIKTGRQIPIMHIVWGIGAILCLAFFYGSYWHCIRGFKESLPVECKESREWLNADKHRRKIKIRYSDRITAPLTFGIIHPVILVPKSIDWKREQEVQYVLTHEYIHIKRYDAVMKWLLILAVSLHWFNPLVWVMFMLANRDMELSCDEQVLNLCGISQKTEYAKMLVTLQEMNKKAAPLCSGFSKSGIEERITAIMKTRRKTTLAIMAAVVVVLAIDIAFATSAKGETLLNDMEQMLPRSNPYGTEEDYKSLFALRIPEGQEFTVDAFRQELVKWVMDDYYRAERVREDIVRGDFNVKLTDEEQDYLIMTYVLLGEENAQKAACLQTGKFGSDTWTGDSEYDGEKNQYYAYVWSKLYYQFINRIEFTDHTDVKGTDAVKICWDTSTRHLRVHLEQDEILDQVIIFAEENKDRLVTHQAVSAEGGK